MNKRVLCLCLPLLSTPVMAGTLLTNSAYDAEIRQWGKIQVRFEKNITVPFSGCENFHHAVMKHGVVNYFEEENGSALKEPDRQIVRNIANECFIYNNLRHRHYVRISENQVLNMNDVIQTYPATMILALSREEERRKEMIAEQYTLKQYDASLTVRNSNEIIDNKPTVYRIESLGDYKNERNTFKLIKVINYVTDGGTFNSTSYYYVSKRDNGKYQAKESSIFKFE